MISRLEDDLRCAEMTIARLRRQLEDAEKERDEAKSRLLEAIPMRGIWEAEYQFMPGSGVRPEEHNCVFTFRPTTSQISIPIHDAVLARNLLASNEIASEARALFLQGIAPKMFDESNKQTKRTSAVSIALAPFCACMPVALTQSFCPKNSEFPNATFCALCAVKIKTVVYLPLGREGEK